MGSRWEHSLCPDLLSPWLGGLTGGFPSAVGGNEQGQDQCGTGLHEAGHTPSDAHVVMVYVCMYRGAHLLVLE